MTYNINLIKLKSHCGGSRIPHVSWWVAARSLIFITISKRLINQCYYIRENATGSFNLLYQPLTVVGLRPAARAGLLFWKEQ